jgi:lysophospholipase L1-like esterase
VHSEKVVTKPDGALGPPAAPGAPAVAPAASLTWRKKLAFVAIIWLTLALLIELVVRVGFFIGDNFSTYYLTFGFVPDLEMHSYDLGGYTKFQPNSVYRYKPERDRTIEMRINSDGFRDPENFVKPKPAGTFRVVTLGESSTFGLANDDDHTYPAMLEQRLRARLPGRKVEVLNLGIPHFRSNNILAAARAELPALQPDIVTLYAGYNNAMVFRTVDRPGALYRTKEWLKSHVVTYRALHPYIVTAYQKTTRLLKRDVVGLPHLGIPVDLPAARVAKVRADARAEYHDDLDSLAAVVQAMGARLVLITQTFTLARLPNAWLAGPARPYLGEVAYVDSMLAAKGSVPAPYSTLLVHHDIVEEFRYAARRHNLVLVDGIGALDRERQLVMASFVHLSDEGNNRLSAAIESTFVRSNLLPLAKPASR